MKSLLLFIIILLSPAAVYASDWVLVGNTRSGDTFYIDKSSIMKEDGKSTVKELQVFNFPQITQSGNIFKQTLLVKVYDCGNQNFTIIEATGQDESGKTVFKENFDQYHQQNPQKRWQKLSDGSMFRKSYKIACN